ncbi:RIIA-RIIB membrane-associated [Yersinia phage phiR1-RT]|uniref:RIIA-RIIB membrane-associated n=1 Tax=Yersinia phage phiR1-RT TaxID=1206558 RepID=I7K2T5_BPPR1|nr:RIIA lysis inhibitor [Yersinia phage phiR1-RT]CCI88581.1 RIIA-RIIB membrane-associated [Yersinia phage phiR1-RT]
MIIQTTDEVIMGNTGESKKFSIATSSKAFKILSSGLYKNKIRAIVRELSCNCIDAHKLNGFTGAFEIQPPTQLDPRFVIRDFGPGLSPEDVMNLYTTYFASTKNNSNDFIGALGLGSKSPFSYTETFTITSSFDGEVRGYTAMLDKGEPVIVPVFVEKMTSEDQTGIEIVVPAKPHDIARWVDEIKYVLRPFAADSVKIKNSSLEVDHFGEFNEYLPIRSNDYEYSGLYAVYGNIVYPLQETPGIKKNWLNIRHQGAYIKFQLGTLDIAASREELSFDDITVKNINERLAVLSKTAMEEDIKQFDEEINNRAIYRGLRKFRSGSLPILAANNAVFGKNKVSYDKMNMMYAVPASEFCNIGVVYEVVEFPRLLRIKDKSSSAATTIVSLFNIENTSAYVVIDDDKKNRIRAVKSLYNMLRKHREKAFLTDEQLEKLPLINSRIIFIDPEDSSQLNLLPDLLKLFEGDKVLMFRTTELDEMTKEYRPVKTKYNSISADGPSEYVPRPSAIEYFKGQAKDLYIAAKDIQEYSGYAVYSKAKSYYAINDASLVVYDHGVIAKIASELGITNFMILNSNLHNRAEKSGNFKCLITELVKRYEELGETVDQEDVVWATSDTRLQRHVTQHKCLNFMAKYLCQSGKSSEAFAKYKSIYTLFLQFHALDTSSYGTVIKEQRAKYSKLIEGAKESASALVESFVAKNPVVYDYMNSRYDLSQIQARDIARIMHALDKE